MHVLTRVTSFSQACQLSPIEETHDSSPSFRRVNLHLGLASTVTSIKKNSIEEASWWSSESPSPCNNFSFETFDTWKSLASEAKELYQEQQQQLIIGEEGDFDFDMTASWSSAATGKPQLSYAERLRKAKEGSNSKKESIIESTFGNDPKEPRPASASMEVQESATVKRMQSKSPQLSIDARMNGSAPRNDTPTSKRVEEGSQAQHSTFKLDQTDDVSSNKSAPIANVWEARRQKLLEQKQKQEQEQQGNISVDISSSKKNLASNGMFNDPGHSSSSSKAPQEDDATRVLESNHHSNAWIKNSKVVEESIKEDIIANMNSVSRDTKALYLQQQPKSLKASRGEQKRSNQAAEFKSKAARSRPPSLGDEQVWPSPDVAATVKAATDDSKDRSSKSTTTTNLTQTDLQCLDVELINPSGGERQRHGKQWISIVPNITHTSPLPSSSHTNSNGKKKGTKSAENIMASSSSSSQKGNKRLSDQRKSSSSSSPMHSDKLNKDPQSKGGGVASPQISEASFLGSPRILSHATSPLLSRSNLVEEGQEDIQRSKFGAFIQNDLLSHADSKTASPMVLRSPSANRGSTRGPRFSGDNRESPNGSSIKWGNASPRSQSQTPNKEVTQEEMASKFGNALHLSKSSNVSSPILSQKQFGSDSIGEISGAPTPVSITSTDSIWHADGKLLNRSRSMAPSPRGSRGRGGSNRRKASDEEDTPGDSGSSVKTDNEMRGLPKGVPSGPKQRNSEGIKSEPAKGNNYRNRHYNNRDGLQYGMQSPPMPSLPYAMPAGIFFPPNHYYGGPPTFASPTHLPIPIEKTPEEFGPSIESSNAEPSRALLNQLEFYFSHRNLEGDFYLRKNMNSQGFVPIALIADFKKVRQMIVNVDVVKRTLVYSKVLEMDSDQVMVRKAVNWHLYTLIDGEKPQFNNVYQQQQHHLQQHSPSQQQQHHHQPYNYISQHSQYAAYPISNLPFTPQSMVNSQIASLPFAPQHSYAPMHVHSQGVYSQNVFSNDHLNSGRKSSGNKEYEGDNDDDEVLGVVAAEGLGGALKM